MMTVSAILATYRAEDWLEKALWGWYAQSYRDFEIIVADDGSGPETRERIDRLREETGMRIEHVWQEDEGFRKCRILNKAILAASGEYLLFSDGDCIPRNDFVEMHLRHSQPGHFLSGGAFRLPLRVSRLISRADILEGRPFDIAWLRAQGVPVNLHTLKLVRGWPGKVLNLVKAPNARWNGGNASGWKQDILAVNGFDERMGYGAEDREMGFRLANAGVRPRQIRHSTTCVHLEHGRPYAKPDIRSRNDEFVTETIRSRRVWTPHGIKKGEATKGAEMGSKVAACGASGPAPRHAAVAPQISTGSDEGAGGLASATTSSAAATTSSTSMAVMHG